MRGSVAILNGSNASSVTTQGLIVDAKFLALKAANGKSSVRWISRAAKNKLVI